MFIFITQQLYDKIILHLHPTPFLYGVVTLEYQREWMRCIFLSFFHTILTIDVPRGTTTFSIEPLLLKRIKIPLK